MSKSAKGSPEISKTFLGLNMLVLRWPTEILLFTTLSNDFSRSAGSYMKGGFKNYTIDEYLGFIGTSSEYLSISN